jgi:hypothetical protein
VAAEHILGASQRLGVGRLGEHRQDAVRHGDASGRLADAGGPGAVAVRTEREAVAEVRHELLGVAVGSRGRDVGVRAVRDGRHAEANTEQDYRVPRRARA